MKTEGHKLGTLLSTLGVIVPDNLRVNFDIDLYLDQLDHALTLDEGERKSLGDLIRSATHITPAQLESALSEQRRDGGELDEILVEKHLLPQNERKVILEFQRRHIGAAAIASELALGNILLALGHVTHDQIEDAVRRQKMSGRSLGDELIEAGHASQSQVEASLRLQRKLIVAALSVAVGLGPMVSLPIPAEAAQLSATMPVSVTVISKAIIHSEYQAARLKVTEADVARGHIDFVAASRFSVSTNSRSGYLLEFRPAINLFESVQVIGLGNPVQLGADGGFIAQRSPLLSGEMHTLNYRFFLRQNTEAGSYPWPLQLTVHPLD
jgi:hypothetical protein